MPFSVSKVTSEEPVIEMIVARLREVPTQALDISVSIGEVCVLGCGEFKQREPLVQNGWITEIRGRLRDRPRPDQVPKPAENTPLPS